jgi:type II secretory pathway pseudopilin PulG
MHGSRHHTGIGIVGTHRVRPWEDVRPGVSLPFRSEGGFTLVELSIVVLLLGFILWLVAPRISAVTGPGRNGLFREMSAASEAAFDAALFEKKEMRLVLDPQEGSYLFRSTTDNVAEAPPPVSLGEGISISGIRLDGTDRPLDIATEIRYLPGGRVPEARIFFRDASTEGEPTDWTLRLDPAGGAFDVLEGKIVKDEQ